VHDRWIPNPSMVREVSVADRRAECTHTYGVQSSTESALTSSTSYSRENAPGHQGDGHTGTRAQGHKGTNETNEGKSSSQSLRSKCLPKRLSLPCIHIYSVHDYYTLYGVHTYMTTPHKYYLPSTPLVFGPISPKLKGIGPQGGCPSLCGPSHVNLMYVFIAMSSYYVLRTTRDPWSCFPTFERIDSHPVAKSKRTSD
jgi:hypothetical protein